MRILRFAVRILTYINYPFLALSILFVMNDFGFGAAFVATFAIENRTNEQISVTPIGSVGEKGTKHPLPVKMVGWAAIDAFQRGGFQLAPGETVTIHYDMDDINFSEIVVDDQRERRYQMVTNPDPTANRYHGPKQDLYVIDALSDLTEPHEDVSDAADRAQGVSCAGPACLAIIFVPWIVVGVLSLISRYSLVNVSSKLSNTRDTTVHAAN